MSVCLLDRLGMFGARGLRVTKASQKHDKVEEIVLTQSLGGILLYMQKEYSEKPHGVGVRITRRAIKPEVMGWLPISIHPKWLVALLPLDFQESAKL